MTLHIGCSDSSVNFNVAPTEDTPISCRDGKDNDKDGKTDCEDPDCEAIYLCDESVDTDLDIETIAWIPLGSATLEMGKNDGDPTESPSRIVYIKSFEFMKTEVTVAQYQTCVEDGACEETRLFDDCGSDEYRELIEASPEIYPMTCVSWYQAAAFCEWLDARLPSEAEWQRVAGGLRNSNTYPWGEAEPTCKFAVIDENGPGCGLGHPAPVCSIPAGSSSFEECDLIGNVREWIEDDVHLNYIDAPKNSDPWIDEPRASGRMVRGGAYDDPPGISSSTRRWCDEADGCDISSEMDGYGFRCAR